MKYLMSIIVLFFIELNSLITAPVIEFASVTVNRDEVKTEFTWQTKAYHHDAMFAIQGFANNKWVDINLAQGRASHNYSVIMVNNHIVTGDAMLFALLFLGGFRLRKRGGLQIVTLAFGLIFFACTKSKIQQLQVKDFERIRITGMHKEDLIPYHSSPVNVR